MLINSRAVALLLAVSISLVTVAFLTLVENTPMMAILVGGVLSFSASFLLIFITFEFLIFKEINSIYLRLTKIKNNDFQDAVLHPKRYSSNPIRRMNQHLTEYATEKQHEVEELKKVASFRREFIADISHELKTPLFSAQGFILTLQDGAVEDEKVRGKFLKKAAKSLDALQVLVEDLLTLSQIEQGDITMYFDVFEMQELVLDVFEQLDSRAEKKNTTLVLENPNPNGIWVNADHHRIMQVMVNLVHNAIKYCPEESHVWVGLELQEADNQVVVSVRDDGDGISEEHLHRIFERFYRVEKSRSRKRGGTGLGLAIVKHIINKHNSQIRVDSEEGKGTRFTFSLEQADEHELEGDFA